MKGKKERKRIKGKRKLHKAKKLCELIHKDLEKPEINKRDIREEITEKIMVENFPKSCLPDKNGVIT